MDNQLDKLLKKSIDYAIFQNTDKNCQKQVGTAFRKGYEECQKEYEEKLRWIPVEENLPVIGIWILIQLKKQPTKNKYVTMLPKNDFEIQYIKENVISWRSFL